MSGMIRLAVETEVFFKNETELNFYIKYDKNLEEMLRLNGEIKESFKVGEPLRFDTNITGGLNSRTTVNCYECLK